MLATTAATWLLVIKLQSIFNPAEARQWDRIYKTSSAEECEIIAQSSWRGFYEHYQNQDLSDRLFTATCSASTSHNEYKWFVKCDKLGNCQTDKYKGQR